MATFRIETTGFAVGENDKLVRTQPRVICDGCGVIITDAKSIAAARLAHACPKDAT